MRGKFARDEMNRFTVPVFSIRYIAVMLGCPIAQTKSFADFCLVKSFEKSCRSSSHLLFIFPAASESEHRSPCQQLGFSILLSLLCNTRLDQLFLFGWIFFFSLYFSLLIADPEQNEQFAMPDH